MYPYPNKICTLCLNNLKNAYEFKKRCLSAFEKLMKLSDFNSVSTEDYNEVKPFMHVDVLIDDDNDILSEENDIHFDENNIDFDEDDTIEPQVNIIFHFYFHSVSIIFNRSNSFVRRKKQRKNIKK